MNVVDQTTAIACMTETYDSCQWQLIVVTISSYKVNSQRLLLIGDICS